MNANVPSLQRSLPDVVAEYDAKFASIDAALATFNQAGNQLKMAATIGGTYGDVTINTGNVWESELKTCLLRSAWKHIYAGLNIDRLASPDDKRRWKMALEKPEAFTIDNIRGTFGRYILDPRGNILRALAEVFCGLDQAYRSHDKVKIGVAGLPKRVILGSVSGYGSYGRDKLIAVLNALASYQEQPLIEHKELAELDALHKWDGSHAGVIQLRGLTIKKYQNNNAHVMFDKATLRDINKALAEFYGEVLPDTTDEKPTKKHASTAVSKDLQYYPTPAKLVDHVLDHYVHQFRGARVLEPQCGCGRFLDGIRKRGGIPFGIEVDGSRAALARAKGYSVLTANFLEVPPPADDVRKFRYVVMNPPFYGQHYAKHVDHGMKFLQPGGQLIAILPVTARDHGLVDGKWDDLPVGSFSESGTNINTTILTKTAPRVS